MKSPTHQLTQLWKYLLLILVAGANAVPTFTSTAITAAKEDSPYTYPVTAVDANNPSLTFTATTLPSWMTFSASSELTGTPTNGQANQSFQVILSVTNGTDVTYQDFNVFVTDSNDAPTGANFSKTALEDNNISFSASDFSFADIDPTTERNTFTKLKITTLPTQGTLTLTYTQWHGGDSQSRDSRCEYW